MRKANNLKGLSAKKAAQKMSQGSDQHAKKREEIIQVISRMLLKKRFDDLKIEAVAQKAKVSQSTLYRYFNSKEEMILEVLKADYVEWFRALRDQCLQGQLGRNDFACWVTRSLEQRPRFVSLLPSVFHLLQKSSHAMIQFKVILASEVDLTAHVLATSLGVTQKQAEQLLTHLHVVATGAWPHGFLSPHIKAIIEQKKLDIFKFNYFEIVHTLMHGLVMGLPVTHDSGSRVHSVP